MTEQRITGLTLAFLGAAVTAVSILRGIERFARWQARPGRRVSYGAIATRYAASAVTRSGVVWTATDELWQRIVGGPGGVMCVGCFDAACERRGLYLRWTPGPL